MPEPAARSSTRSPVWTPALLSKRLRTLERAGVIDRLAEDTRSRYVLTASGDELRRTVVVFDFDDVAVPVARWWVCGSEDEVDICDFDPGFDVDVTVSTSLRTMIEIWRGDRSWVQGLRAAAVELTGSRELRDALPQMIGQMTAAGVLPPRDRLVTEPGELAVLKVGE